jgi:hypothetical protein
MVGLVMKVYNYIRDGFCIPIVADSRPEADSLFIKEHSVKVDKVPDNPDDQYCFDFPEVPQISNPNFGK